MSSGNPSRHVSPAAVSLRSEQDDTLMFESRFESANLAKAVQMFVSRSIFLLFLTICIVMNCWILIAVLWFP